ncbi:MAG: PAS domain S-box protein [Candidatus Omnitrophica bacterium]|nr:PAS domain S-box protein [Candidatus Omnitrophota bacterium]
MVLAGLVSIHTSKIIQNRFEKLVEQDIKTTHFLANIAKEVSFIRSNSLLYLIGGSIDDKKRYESEIIEWQNAVNNDLYNLNKILTNQATRDKLADFQASWEKYLRIWSEEVIPLSRAGRGEEAFALVRKKGVAGTAAQEAMYKIHSLHDAIVLDATYTLQSTQYDFKKKQIVLLTIIFLAIMLGLTFGIKQSALIARAVNTVSKTAQLVAAGDLNQSVKDVRTGDEIEAMADSFNIMISNMKEIFVELRYEINQREMVEKALKESKDGLEVMVGKRTSELKTANEQLRKEITERKQSQEAAERLRRQNELVLNSAGEGIFGLDLVGRHTFVNPSAAKMLGFEVDELIGRPSHAIWHHSKADGSLYLEEECPIYAVYKDGAIHNARDNEVFWRKNGTSFPVEYTSTPIVEDGKIAGAVVTFRDITKRKHTETQLQHQIERIKTLRDIDITITSSLDLRVTLNVFLEELIVQMRVNAAAVLLLNPNTLTLEYTSSRGFRSQALQHTCLRLGEGHAGRAALEHCIISIPDLSKEKDGFSRSPLFAEEEFIAYYCIPLISKGCVKGILEIFHRAQLNPDQEWLDFLQTLATQAAIAIDNASLFEDLQRSNVELTLAYDTTLEGWSKALDLRDKETEGHSQRVTDMTIKIARIMGVSEPDLVHARRGALLHDIGKLGIPDSILLKPGQLNEEEWKIMRKHPTFAYELLSPIAFLHAALDIPYYTITKNGTVRDTRMGLKANRFHWQRVSLP